VLSWVADSEKDAVRLERTLLTPAAATKVQHGALATPPEAVKTTLLVDSGLEKGRAIDKAVHFGEKYAYRAQRVSRIEVEGKTLELAGEFSLPVEVQASDVFPPGVPTGLAAVATVGANGAGPSIDLSWQVDPDVDLAGYVVYRREGDGAWQRISGATAVVEPAFHDDQVQAGRSYHYAVSAVGKNEHESDRSEEAQETVPQP
jgi:hypothetical protein